MSDTPALKLAIDLVHVPSQVRLLRREPLPEGVPTLLRLAAGDQEAESAAVELTGRSAAVVRQAAAFFVEQILFAPNADSYRVLGASHTATAAELRRNAALLMRWLHPDLDPRGERSIFAGRVTAAWNDLKTPDRRAAYDALLQRSVHKHRGRNGYSRRGRTGSGDRRQGLGPQDARLSRGFQRMGFLWRALSVLFHRPLP